MAENRLVFLGDSITDGVGSEKRYTDMIAEMSGCEVYNYGVNGASSLDLMSQIDRMEAEIGDQFDCLCIFIGTNDFNGSVALGDWFTETTADVPRGLLEDGTPSGYIKRKKREFIMTPDTFRGRLNTVLSRLREAHADKRFLLITPIHRGYAFFGGENYQPEELYSNMIGEYVESYVQAMREAADLWACELIDLYRDSGFFPMARGNAALYFHDTETDRLHPNKAGHERMAKIILSHLTRYPYRFSDLG